MRKKSRKITEKFVTEATFEKHMRSIAESFTSQGQVLEMILKELQALHNDHKDTLKTLLSFTGDVSSHDRKINNLTVRVEKIETQSK